MTGEQVRWGLENLALDQKKLDALGFDGVLRPIRTSCADHMGSTWARIQTWDGTKWKIIVRLVQGRRADHQADGEGRGREVRGREEDRAAATASRADARPDRGWRNARLPTAVQPHGAIEDCTLAGPRRRQRGYRAAVLDVNGIEVIYNHVILVLKGVSLQVPEGGIVALLGGNGAGKTTTLQAISNLLRGRARRGDQGLDRVRGERIEGLHARRLVRRGCIQVMEGRHCFAHLTIEENLLTGAYTRRDGSAAIAADLEKVYALFPAPEGAARLAGRLHLGRRAADVRDRPRADGEPEDGAAGRAVDGAGAADRRGGVRDREATSTRRSG